MLTLEDCIALCDLTEDEVLEIARHETCRLRALGLKMILRNYILRHPACEDRHLQALVAKERRRPD